MILCACNTILFDFESIEPYSLLAIWQNNTIKNKCAVLFSLNFALLTSNLGQCDVRVLNFLTVN